MVAPITQTARVARRRIARQEPFAMQRRHRSIRRIRSFLACALTASLMVAPSCLNSDISKRFRESYGPGLVDGLSTFITDPANAEAGLQQTGAALFEGIGAIIQPRTGSSAAGQ